MLQGALPPCLSSSGQQECPIKMLQTLGGQQLYQTCTLQIHWLFWVNWRRSFVSVLSPICFPALPWMPHTPSMLKVPCCHHAEAACVLGRFPSPPREHSRVKVQLLSCGMRAVGMKGLFFTADGHHSAHGALSRPLVFLLTSDHRGKPRMSFIAHTQ